MGFREVYDFLFAGSTQIAYEHWPGSLFHPKSLGLLTGPSARANYLYRNLTGVIALPGPAALLAWGCGGDSPRDIPTTQTGSSDQEISPYNGPSLSSGSAILPPPFSKTAGGYPRPPKKSVTPSPHVSLPEKNDRTDRFSD